MENPGHAEPVVHSSRLDEDLVHYVGAVLVWVEDAGKGCEGGVGDDGGDGGRASSRDGQVDDGE